MEAKDEKRKGYLDCAKGLGILLMMLGHLLQPDSVGRRIIYSFHMPLFFMISGMNFKVRPFSVNVRSKFRGLYVPYIIWGFIYTRFSFQRILYILYGTIESLEYIYTKSSLWFLPCLFWTSVIGGKVLALIDKSKYTKYLLIIGGIFFSVFSLWLHSFHESIMVEDIILGVPLALDVVFLGISFFLAGKFLIVYVMPTARQWNQPLYFLTAILLISFCGLAIFQETDCGYQRMASYDIGNVYEFLFTGITVSMGVIMLFEAVCRRIQCRALQWVGRHSLLVYILHASVLKYFKAIYSEQINIGTLLLAWIGMTVCSCGITLIVERLFYTNKK